MKSNSKKVACMHCFGCKNLLYSDDPKSGNLIEVVCQRLCNKVKPH